MRVGSKRLFTQTSIVMLMVLVGTIAGWAQCTAPPNYSPDFSGPSVTFPNASSQSCLTLNGENYSNGITTGPATPYANFYPAVPTPPPGVTTVLRLTPNQPAWTGSAWYNTPQPVSGPFSTTFTFQLSGPAGDGAGDGFAFVIQNSGTNALGPEGCGIGFGMSAFCQVPVGPQTGIPNSLGIEFNTYQNYPIDPSGSDVTIQNCSGTGPNSVDPSCSLGVNDLTKLANPINLADGNVHTVTITYSPSSLTNCGPEGMSTCSSIDVLLDNNVDLFPGNSVLFNIPSIGLTNGTAYVGFTGATYAALTNQDILSWTFTPQAQSAVITTSAPSVLTFPNASGTPVYSYQAQLTTPYAQPVLQVQPILISSQACNQLVDQNFWPARCFVYENAENTGVDTSVMFAVTCPDSTNQQCNDNDTFFATLGTNFSFTYSDNPFFFYPGFLGFLNPFPGWLKGAGPNTANPCQPPASGPLFTSNQIESFSVSGDPGGRTLGGSGGTGSCWVATYDTPGEIWPGITISSPTFTTYKQGQMVTAAYTCSNPSTSKNSLTSATGPYLTASSCTQATGKQASCSFTPPPGGGLSCTGSVPTSNKGLQLFTVTGVDSGGNQNIDIVIYNVK
jgi:hypothetical protein